MHSQKLLVPAQVQNSVPASHAVFCAWRHHTLLAFQGWLLAAPDHENVALELEGTVNALRLMAAVHQHGAGREGGI